MVGRAAVMTRRVGKRGVTIMRRLLLGLAALLTCVLPAAAEEPGFVSFGAGYYDLFDDQGAGEARLEYRFSEPDKLFFFTPFVGVMTTTDAATYGYAGLGIDVFFGRRWVLTPNFAVGVYGDGDGKDLGHAVEFRSGLELAYRFDRSEEHTSELQSLMRISYAVFC